MKIRVQSIHFDADQKLLELIQKKTDKFDQFFDHITDGEIFLKLENNEEENNKVIEIKLSIPGHTLFSKGQAKTFEVATEPAIESMKKQLSKHKDKAKEHTSNHKAILV